MPRICEVLVECERIVDSLGSGLKVFQDKCERIVDSLGSGLKVFQDIGRRIILAVLLLLFGASKLPELARGSGQALRIFKSETKGLMDGDTKSDDADEGPRRTT